MLHFLYLALTDYQAEDQEILSEEFNGSGWQYTIVNDSVIEKTKSTGGNTTFFYKTDKIYLDNLLDLDECNY